MAELVGRAQEPRKAGVSEDFLSLLALISLRSHDDVSVLRPTAAIVDDVAHALGHGASDEQSDTGTTSVAKMERTGRELAASVAAKLDLDLGGMFNRKARGARQSAVRLETVERSLETLHEHGRAVERYHYDVGDSRTGVLWRAASAPLMSTLDEVRAQIDYQGVPILESPMWESQLEVAFLTVLVLRMHSELDEGSIADAMCRVFGVPEADGTTDHIQEVLTALRNGGLMAKGAAGQRKYELDERWGTIGISNLREEIRAVVPSSEARQRAAQQENLPRAEDAQPLNDGQAASKLRYILHDDIYQAVLRIISGAPSTMSQETVTDLVRSSLGIPDSEARYVKPGADRTQFWSLVWVHGLRKLRDEGKIDQVPGGFKHAATSSAGESVPAGERMDDKRPEVEAAEADALERPSERAASIADAADGDRSKRLDRAERSGFARRCAEYATALQELVGTEGRESEVVAGAGFDLIGWRQPAMTTSWTVDAFAYRFVEDAASLHGGLADQMRSNLAAIRSYLRTKPELKGVGVGVTGRVLVSEPFTENARKTLLAAWNPSGKPRVEVNVVPLPPSPTNVVPVPNAGSVPNAAGLMAPIVQALREAAQPLGEDDLSWRIHEKLGLDDAAWTYKVNPSHPLPKFLHELKIARERLTKEGQIERGADGWRVTSGEDVAGATAPPRDDSPAGEPESLEGSTTAGDEGSTVLIDPFVPRVTPLLLNILKDAEQPLNAREIERRVRAELDRDRTGAAVATEPDDITRAKGGLANAALIEFHGGRWTVTEAGRQSVALEESVAKEAMAEEDWAEFRLAVGGDEKRSSNQLLQEIHDAFEGESGKPFERLCQVLVETLPNIVDAAVVHESADHTCDVIGYDEEGDEVCFVQSKLHRDDGEHTNKKFVTTVSDIDKFLGNVERSYLKKLTHQKRVLVIWMSTGRIHGAAQAATLQGTTVGHSRGAEVDYVIWDSVKIASVLLHNPQLDNIARIVRRKDEESGEIREFARVNRTALRNFRTDKA